MTRNKPRLYLAMYARPKYPGTYHVALLVGPKKLKATSTFTKHHVKNIIRAGDIEHSQPWTYERLVTSDIIHDVPLLVMITLSKVLVEESEIDKILAEIPIYQKDDPDTEKATRFNCVAWLDSAVNALQAADTLSCSTPWSTMLSESTAYVNGEVRRGRWHKGWRGTKGLPVRDLETGKIKFLS